MRTTTIRSPSRMLSLCAAGLVLVVAMLGHAVLAAPDASAVPGLTPDENSYVSCLAERDIGPAFAVGDTYYDLAEGGHRIAYDIRRGVDPVDEAYAIYKATNLSLNQSVWEVACAVAAFAPEMIPPSNYAA